MKKEKKTNNAPMKEQVTENGNNKLVVEFTTVDGYMAALERKHSEPTFTWERDCAFRELTDYIENDYKGFGDVEDYNKYYVMAKFNFTPLQYLRLKYLQGDTSARNNIGDFIASKNASAGSIIGDLQHYAKEIVRHAENFTDNMEILDLCYYIVFKLEEKEK